jgi:L-ascorbate metabolism protein UlaG (beta-lactamase superfamily)
MFDIEYKGANGVVITTKKTTVVIDPKLSVAGLKDLSVKNTVEIATEARFAVNDGSSLVTIESPGDYEIADFSISGIAATRHIDTSDVEKKATIYRIEVGDVRIALLGNIAPELSDNQLEELGVIDILIIPVGGGGYTLDATSAAALVRHIDPKAVIPVHYGGDNAIKYEVPQDVLDVFVKELSAPLETIAKYKLKGASSLPPVVTVIQVTRS